METSKGFRIFICVALLVTSAQTNAVDLLFADHPLAGKIWDMRNHSFIKESVLLSSTNQADVLLLGETHDNPVHHKNQLRLYKAKIASGHLPALMMEQLNADDQQALDWTLSGESSEETLERASRLIRFSDLHAYQPFLATAIENRLPVIAANISTQRSQPVIWNGFAAYDADELKHLVVEKVWSEARQKFLVENMGGAHCGKLRDELREGLTRGQRLRDALMVDSAISSVGRSVVGIVGSSHARWDIGLPLYFAARAPEARIITVGFLEVSPGLTSPDVYEADSATGELPYDFVWFTPRVDRVNPCANLLEPIGGQP